jgi:hypothetical protein
MTILIKKKKYNTKTVIRKIKRVLFTIASATEYTMW